MAGARKFNPLVKSGLDYYEPSGAASNGLPIGGTANQILKKNSTTDYDTSWTDPSAGTPATTVTDETTYGVSKAVGTSTNYAREDHSHGTMATPTKTTVGLANVDNTSDASKPVSTAQQTALDAKVNLDGSNTMTGNLNLTKTTSVGVTLTSDTSWPLTMAQNSSSVFSITNGGSQKVTLDASGNLAAVGTVTGSNLSGTNTGDQDLSGKVTANGAITGATKTKITYDAKGLVTAGVDATTADIADSTNKRYVTDAQLTVIGNTSGTNTGDQTLPTDATISTSDVTTNNASTLKHGWLPKLPGTTTTYLRGDGTFTTVSASGDGLGPDGDKGDITVGGTGTTLTIDNGAVTEAKLGLTDLTTANASTTAHGLVVKATAPAANQLNVVGIGNGETEYTNKTIIGSTTPSTQAYGDVAAHGTSVEAAAADHKHAMPASTKDTTAITGMLKGNGTTVSAGTDGTDFYSSAQAIPAANVPNGISAINTAIQSQVTVAGTNYYITGSSLTMPATNKTGGGMSTSTAMEWQFMINKTAAGTGAFNIVIYRGTNGSTSDTADVTQSIGTQTAAVDTATIFVTLKVTATGATGSYTWGISVHHKAATAAGFGTTDATPFFSGTVSSVAMNTASLKFGLGFASVTGTPTVKVAGLVAQCNNMN